MVDNDAGRRESSGADVRTEHIRPAAVHGIQRESEYKNRVANRLGFC